MFGAPDSLGLVKDMVKDLISPVVVLTITYCLFFTLITKKVGGLHFLDLEIQ
jgi:hypothetical protein